VKRIGGLSFGAERLKHNLDFKQSATPVDAAQGASTLDCKIRFVYFSRGIDLMVCLESRIHRERSEIGIRPCLCDFSLNANSFRMIAYVCGGRTCHKQYAHAADSNVEELSQHFNDIAVALYKFYRQNIHRANVLH
jgi:hypothetical protein